MKRLAIPGAILLGALVGAGGYFAAAKLGGAGAQPKAASAEDVAALRQAVVSLQDRMVKQEAKPSLKEGLDDPALREQLAAIVIEAQNPGTFQPRPPQPGSEAWRTSMTRQCRADYARLLEEARVALKITDQEYKNVKPVFEKHFEPVVLRPEKLG